MIPAILGATLLISGCGFVTFLIGATFCPDDTDLALVAAALGVIFLVSFYLVFWPVLGPALWS